MKAIIMAGGEGSRLRPLTCDCPKPMLPLMGKPLMEYALRLLKKHGISEIGATLGYLPDNIMDYFGDGSEFGVNLHYYIEKTPLGTAGSVKQARDFLDERFIVLSGDGITDFDLQAALDFHQKTDAHATLILKKYPNPQEYGMVVTDTEGRIQSFHEKPGRSDVFSDRINTGIYILEPELLGRIPDDRPFDFGHDFFPALLKDGVALYGYTAKGYWCDVGNVPAYLRVHMDAMEGKIQLDGLSDKASVSADGAILESGCRLDSPCFIGKGSRIAPGTHIGPYTVIGENCRIDAHAGIKRSLLFSGVQIESSAQLRGCIIGSNGQVGESAQLYEDSVVGSRSRVGARAVLPPGVKLWPEKNLPDGQRSDENIVWGSCREQRFIGGGMEIEGPVQASRAAQACVAQLKPREVLLGRDASAVSSALWHAAAAGIMAQGVQVIDASKATLPQLRHTLTSLQADTAILISDGRMFPLLPDGSHIPEKTQRAILKLCERQDFAAPFHQLTRPVESLGCTDMSYIAHAASAFKGNPALASPIAVFAQSSHLLGLAEQAFRRAGLHVRSEWDARNMLLMPDETGVYLSEDGQQAFMADAGGRLDEVQRQLLIAWTALESGETQLILHNSASRAIENLAAPYKARIRYLPGEHALWMQTLAKESPLQFQLQFDGVYCALAALSMLTQRGLTLAQWSKQMPRIFRKSCTIPVPPSESARLLMYIAENSAGAELGGGVRLLEKDCWAWLSPNEYRPELNIMAEAVRMEAAEELCGSLEKKLRSLMKE